MDSKLTIGHLQRYIKINDYKPGLKYNYMLKFMEECGELARAIHHGLPHAGGGDIKETIEEEFCDVLFYLCAIANLYDVDIEKWFPIKEKETDKRYNTNYFNEFFAATGDGV